jgi:hypothetical protein
MVNIPFPPFGKFEIKGKVNVIENELASIA